MMTQIIEFIMSEIVTLLSSEVIFPFVGIWVCVACVDIIFLIIKGGEKK